MARSVLGGKCKKQSALDAGYALSTAEVAAAAIEGPGVRAAFKQLLRRPIRMEKLVQRIAEGVDATEIKFFQHEGKVVETVEVVDWAERRKYIELAVKYAGYYVDEGEVEVGQKPMETWTQQQLIEFILDRLALLPAEALLALTAPPPQPSSPPCL